MAWKNDQVSDLETKKIIEIAKGQVGAQGDFVELGCYKGDTSLLLAETLKGSDQKLWVYDSFEGLPEKSAEDVSVVGENFKGGELFVTKREVKERFLRSGLPVPIIKKAWFNELEDEDLPERIALAFLDGDFYGSIKVSLKLVGNRMCNGGKIIIHDYNNEALPGVKKAADEWSLGKNVKKEVYQSILVITL